jgi:hypothetical protein
MVRRRGSWSSALVISTVFINGCGLTRPDESAVVHEESRPLSTTSHTPFPMSHNQLENYVDECHHYDMRTYSDLASRIKNTGERL